MNKVVLIGRLVDDPEVRFTSGDKPMAVARYKLAVDRKIKPKDGGQSADFPQCIAFGSNGEFAKKFLKKGVKIAVEGRLQTGSYTNKEGVKVYTTEVVVESHEFCESKKTNGNETPAGFGGAAQNGSEGFSGGFQPPEFYPNAGEDFAMLEGEDGQLPF